MAYYDSRNRAENACTSDNTCTGFYDERCDGRYWYLCSGDLMSESSSCAWMKGMIRWMLYFLKQPILWTYINIIRNTIIALHLYACIALVTYDGWCEDIGGYSDHLSQSDEDSFVECSDKCYRDQKCTAFSYETPTDSRFWNCNLQKGGPYTSGSGRPNTKCYLTKRGTFIAFALYINEYTYIDKNF